ncbi:MAG: hypothetical protein ACRD2T_04620 [Thermoanaerobaculia bacterium]
MPEHLGAKARARALLRAHPTEKSLLGLRGDRDANEETGREEVVLSGLVDDADQAVLLRRRVRQGAVDLPRLERSFVAAVVHAKDVGGWLRFHGDHIL